MEEKNKRVKRNWTQLRMPLLSVVGILFILLATVRIMAPNAKAQPSGDWPTYMLNEGRGGFNGAETTINPSTAPNLKLHWSYQSGGIISSQPSVANGLIYWGSWDGIEHATRLDGTEAWEQNLGQAKDSSCSPSLVGVASTATVATVTLKGTPTSVVFVGGGNATFYALDANSGNVIWQTSLGLSPSHFIWSSPVVYNGSVYIGVSSFGDCPLVQGQLVQLDATAGAILHAFNVVPDGCLGGSVWGSPTIDTGDGSVYFATGNAGTCSTLENYTIAIIKLSATDLTYLSSWQIPNHPMGDSDFGSTPTLFQATIKGVMRNLVGVVRKNGLYFAFDRSNLSKGPVWRAKVANIGGCGPECGSGSISPSAWDGQRLYVAGGITTINSTNCAGSLRALNPANGSFIWQDCFTDGPVLGGVSGVPGLIAVGEGNHLVIVDSSNGNILFTYQAGSRFYGSAASISGGVLYIGNKNHNLYAFGT